MGIPKALAPAVTLAGALALAGCGGGGGQNFSVNGPPVSDVEAESVHLSDLLFSDPVEGDDLRASINCRPSGLCSANFDGLFVVQFNVNEFGDLNTDPGDPDISGSATLYNTYGDWNDTVAAAIHQRFDGTTARYALAYGETHPNSLPLTGSATWRGDMAGLDADNRGVRGGAEITVADLSDPLADVTLTPRARAAMRWQGLPVIGGKFSEELRRDDYIRGEFYGRSAGEAGGVFERSGVVGAFGAERPKRCRRNSRSLTCQTRKERAMPLPITVSGPRTDDSERNVGKNAIVIAMTRYDAGYLKDILRHYGRPNRTDG